MVSRSGGSPGASQRPPAVQKGLEVLAAEAVVRDFLSCQGYQYTLSVFVPEAGLSGAEAQNGGKGAC